MIAPGLAPRRRVAVCLLQLLQLAPASARIARGPTLFIRGLPNTDLVLVRRWSYVDWSTHSWIWSVQGCSKLAGRMTAGCGAGNTGV